MEFHCLGIVKKKNEKKFCGLENLENLNFFGEFIYGEFYTKNYKAMVDKKRKQYHLRLKATCGS